MRPREYDYEWRSACMCTILDRWVWMWSDDRPDRPVQNGANEATVGLMGRGENRRTKPSLPEWQLWETERETKRRKQKPSARMTDDGRPAIASRAGITNSLRTGDSSPRDVNCLRALIPQETEQDVRPGQITHALSPAPPIALMRDSVQSTVADRLRLPLGDLRSRLPDLARNRDPDRRDRPGVATTTTGAADRPRPMRPGPCPIRPAPINLLLTEHRPGSSGRFPRGDSLT